MRQFRIPARLTGPTGLAESTELLADTGATLVDGQEVTTPGFISPGGPALLGAVALERLFLAVDPIAKRLVPTKGFIL